MTIVRKPLDLKISRLSNAKYETMLPQAGTLGGLGSNMEPKKSAFITKIS